MEKIIEEIAEEISEANPPPPEPEEEDQLLQLQPAGRKCDYCPKVLNRYLKSSICYSCEAKGLKPKSPSQKKEKK